MQRVNIHEAKTHLSRLIEQAARGESFVIAKAGKPLVKVVHLEAPEPGRVRRLGFLRGEITVPDDFDRMGEQGIAALFNSDACERSCCWIRICCCGVAGNSNVLANPQAMEQMGCSWSDRVADATS
jgi:prevent-host-death family protein